MVNKMDFDLMNNEMMDLIENLNKDFLLLLNYFLFDEYLDFDDFQLKNLMNQNNFLALN